LYFSPGLPHDFEADSYVPPAKPICIIDYLCQHYDGITTDAKVIKKYFWKTNLKKLIERKVTTFSVYILNYNYPCKQ